MPAPARPFVPGKIELPLHRRVNRSFLDYASYVIRDRAIPNLADGLKPVQRRILWALHEKDDGRFIKVANVVGHAMQYHPHGDASIGDALVVLANKRYLIEGQGNFGNIFTGDPAAAPRYIECRLTELARTELFNDEITEFVPSYDGRNKEPVTLPCKLPLLLMLGTEGIAVGMSSRILPHNFPELLEAQIAILKKQPFKCLPDFQTGGLMDARDYKDGTGEIKVRAKIKVKDESTVVIKEIPPTTTTDSLIASIEDASRKGKIKVKSINDFTSEEVEIEVKAPSGVSAEQLVDALYAFTDCEVTIASRIVVIRNNRPVEMTVSEVLRENTAQLVEILKRELELQGTKLQDELHFRTLERIFIEERIYKKIEQCKTNEAVLAAVHDGFKPFRRQLIRELTDAGRRAAAHGAHPPHLAVRHQQAPRGDGEGEGRPGRDAQEPEEPDQVRHRPPRSVARQVRPAVSAPDQVQPLRRGGREGSRVQGVQGGLRPRVRLRRPQGLRRGVQRRVHEVRQADPRLQGRPLPGDRAAGEVLRRAGPGLLRPAGARAGVHAAPTPTARRPT